MKWALHGSRQARLATLVWLLALAHAPASAQARIYFSAFLGEGGTAIERSGLDGSGLEVVQSEPSGFENGLALDMPDGKVYWADTAASVIRRELGPEYRGPLLFTEHHESHAASAFFPSPFADAAILTIVR